MKDVRRIDIAPPRFSVAKRSLYGDRTIQVTRPVKHRKPKPVSLFRDLGTSAANANTCPM